MRRLPALSLQPNGFIFDDGNTGHGPMHDHGFATLFLGEVYGMTKSPRLRNGLERAVQLIINSQNKEEVCAARARLQGRRPLGDNLPDHGPPRAQRAESSSRRRRSTIAPNYVRKCHIPERLSATS